MEYSFKKGLVKGAVSLLSLAGALASYAGFSDLTVAELVERYIPALGSLSVGAAIVMAVNYLKVRFLSA